jgi:hypothetical protein
MVSVRQTTGCLQVEARLTSAENRPVIGYSRHLTGQMDIH